MSVRFTKNPAEYDSVTKSVVEMQEKRRQAAAKEEPAKKETEQLDEAPDRYNRERVAAANRRTAADKAAKTRAANTKKAKSTKKEEVEQLDEAATRKHFREVANIVRAIEDPKKRQEFADHHAEIFAKQNPRFDRAKFHAAAGTQWNTSKPTAEVSLVVHKKIKGFEK